MSQTVASTEFQTHAGLYLDESGREPVIITRYNRPVRVLIDIQEYERLKACDSRRAWFAHEIPDEWLPALAAANVDHIDPELNKLLS